MTYQPSIKKNFAYNMLYTVSGVLFPLITFPYVSRILLAEGIGQVHFFMSIISYVILFSSLGLPLYAFREIAKVRNDPEAMRKTAMEILLLHSLLSVVGYAVAILMACTIAKIQVNVPLFLILSLLILFNAIGAEWFYSGIEDFRYIALRSLFVRCLCLVALFVFVKEKEDLLYYGIIHLLSTAGNYLFNFIRLRKIIRIRDGFKDLQIGRHVRPTLKIFTLNLIVSLYVNLDAVMLGFMKNETTVGYYGATTRITRTLVGIVTSLNSVLLPRLTSMAKEGKVDDFRMLIDKCNRFIIALALPLMIGIIFMASPLIHLFCGETFEPSILTLQLIAPIILLTPLFNLYDMQILYALGREKLAIISVSIGALLNFVLNWLLIPTYAQYGAAIAMSIAECSVALSAIFFGRKYVPFRFFSKDKRHYYWASLFIILFLFLLKQVRMSEMYYFVIGTSSSILIYIAYLQAVKDDVFIVVKNLLKQKRS